MVFFKFTSVALLLAVLTEIAVARPQLSNSKPALRRRYVNDSLLQTAAQGHRRLNDVNLNSVHRDIPLPDAVHPELHPGHRDLVNEANNHRQNAINADNARNHAARFEHQSNFHVTMSKIHEEKMKGYRSDSQQHSVEQADNMNHKASAAAALGVSKHIGGDERGARKNYGLASKMHGVPSEIKEEVRNPLEELKNHN